MALTCTAVVGGLEEPTREGIVYVFYIVVFQLSFEGRIRWCWWERSPLQGP